MSVTDYDKDMANMCMVTSLIWWAWGFLCFGLFHYLDDTPMSTLLLFMAINVALFMQAFMEWRHHLRVIEIKEYCLGVINEIERKVQP
jgi:hypothetical protein